MRKLILIVLSVSAAVGVVTLGYFARKDSVSAKPADSISNISKSPFYENKLGANTANKDIFYTPSDESEKITAYFPSENDVLAVFEGGDVFRIYEGEEQIRERISSSSLSGIISASFSNSGKTVLANHGEFLNPVWSYMSISDGVWRRLPIEAQSAAWSPRDEIAVVYEVGEVRRGISTIDFSPKTPRSVFVSSISLENPTLSWPDQNTLILGEMPGAHARSSTWTLNLKNKTFSLLAEDQIGLDSAWSLSGGAVFTTQGGPGTGEFAFSDLNGDIQSIFTFLTLPHKCGFSENGLVLVCGVPKNEDFISRDLPDAYLNGSLFTDDKIFSVKTDSGELREVPVSGGPVDVERVQVKKGWIYFINRLDGKLYRVNK